MAHVRPAYENVSLHGDVFSQVSVAFAQSCLPTGGALSAHWQLPLPKAACPLLVPFLPIGRCLSVVPLSLRCRVTSEACVHMPGLAYKFDSLLGDVPLAILPFSSPFYLLSLLHSVLWPHICLFPLALSMKECSLLDEVFVPVSISLRALPSAFYLLTSACCLLPFASLLSSIYRHGRPNAPMSRLSCC